MKVPKATILKEWPMHQKDCIEILLKRDHMKIKREPGKNFVKKKITF